ncbi:D-alanyl-D-alanine endopeptidase [Chitinibacteraceae bacterium HSL-7]
MISLTFFKSIRRIQKAHSFKDAQGCFRSSTMRHKIKQLMITPVTRIALPVMVVMAVSPAIQAQETTQRAPTTQQTNVAGKATRDARSQVNASHANVMQSVPGVQSSGVLVLNESNGEVIYQKNADTVAPIASITKLMTAMVVLDAAQPMNELLTVEHDDVDTLKNTTSRLAVGTRLTRAEMLLLALMSSENRAASALSRHYPGGRSAFVARMNAKARQIGMTSTVFFDATGLTPSNVSTARDLARMVSAARHYPEIHHFSTASEYAFTSNLSGREMQFRNTNPLVRDENWTIGVSKTGYINEAGRCLVMQALISETPVVMVLLDSQGKQTRIGDANRVRKWLENNPYAKLVNNTF